MEEEMGIVQDKGLTWIHQLEVGHLYSNHLKG